jgi:hypothetical protein
MDIYKPAALNTAIMASVTLYPSRVTQTTTGTEVGWSVTETPGGREDYRRCGTQDPLRTTLTATNSTGKLHWAGYSTTLTGTLTAVKIRVYADKRSRVQDHTIQLTVDGTATGSNLAVADSGNDHLYSAQLPTGITLDTVHRLGVLTQYKSGDLPHLDHCYVDTVWLELTYTP